MTHVTLERRWTFDLAAEFGHRDVTSDVQALVHESGVQTGIAVVQMVGSTGGITTIEYESGALADLRRALETVAPADAQYEHNARWGTVNGFSHLNVWRQRGPISKSHLYDLARNKIGFRTSYKRGHPPWALPSTTASRRAGVVATKEWLALRVDLD